MPSLERRWGRLMLMMMMMMTLINPTISLPGDITTHIPPLQNTDASCGGEVQAVTEPNVDVTWERNTSQISIHCPARLNTFFTALSNSPLPSPPSSDIANVSAGRRGVVVSLSGLEQVEEGVQVVLDVENCGCVDLNGGLPAWVQGVTFAIRGPLRLPKDWWFSGGSSGLTDMWVRVSGGLSSSLSPGGVCEFIPPSLRTLDLSYTPVQDLTVGPICSRSLSRMEAIWATVTSISLCTPALTTLYVNNNEIPSDISKWSGCEGGLESLMYLHASNNHITTSTTCALPSLTTLDLKGNWLTSLDLTSCPPVNLTSLIASRNYLTHTPSPLPPLLVFIDLSHNNITTLPILPRAMQEADFSHNNIQVLGEGRFRRARKLHHLNLAHNNIKHIKERDFFGLKRLNRLDLSYNKIESIAMSTFFPYRHLRHLHLHHNHLTHLDARFLEALISHTTHATLHHNPWECNCQMLAALTQLQSCPDCKHKRVSLQCKERDHLLDATTLLRTCIHAIDKHTQGLVDESDEDYSEEIKENEGNAAGAVVLVPILVIIIILSISVAGGYKLYRKHRRAIVTTFTPFCACCDRCGDSVSSNNHTSNHHHHHHQEAAQLPTGELQDSDTETEM